MFQATPTRDHYEECMEPIRARFAANRTVVMLQASDTNPVLLELFLIYFATTGVSMTEHVEDWIRRAGERCDRIGLRELGRALRRHSIQEAGHHLMLRKDAQALINRWNVRQPVRLDAVHILDHGMTEGARRYRLLHEETIAGNTPFAQLAIEYEIEGLSVRLGPRLIRRCREALGPAVTAGLRFLRHHVALDIGHTRFNQKQLDRLLQQHPEFLDPLVNAGERALQAYGMFLENCLLRAERQLEHIR